MSRRPGRPSKLTPEVRDNFIKALESGCYVHDAAEFAGVGASTALAWAAKGQADDATKEFREFSEAVKKARSVARAVSVIQIKKAGEKTWQANAWFLERTDPEHFAQRLWVEVNKELESFFAKLRQKLPPETYELVVAAGRSDT